MGYLYKEVANANFEEYTPERRAFRRHLSKVAEALHRIELKDSGDGDHGEAQAIRACLNPNDVLSTLLTEARELEEQLRDERERLALTLFGGIVP